MVKTKQIKHEVRSNDCSQFRSDPADRHALRGRGADNFFGSEYFFIPRIFLIIKKRLCIFGSEFFHNKKETYFTVTLKTVSCSNFRRKRCWKMNSALKQPVCEQTKQGVVNKQTKERVVNKQMISEQQP